MYSNDNAQVDGGSDPIFVFMPELNDFAEIFKDQIFLNSYNVVDDYYYIHNLDRAFTISFEDNLDVIKVFYHVMPGWTSDHNSLNLNLVKPNLE